MRTQVQAGNRSKALRIALLLSLWFSLPVSADTDYPFDTASQPLTQALKNYAQTTHQQIIFTEDLVDGKTAPPLKGQYTAQDALSKLLMGTGLTAEKSPSGALMIKKQASASSVAAMETALLRVAQQTEGESATVDAETKLEEVVVTGTHIRGPPHPLQLLK